MADFKKQHSLLPGMKPRPEVILQGKMAAEETLKSESSATFLFLKNCSDYKLNWEGKAAKVMCENCSNVTIVLSEPLITGVMEIYKSKIILIRLTQSAEIPIFQVDDSDDVSIEINEKSIIKSVYFQRSTNIKAIVCGAEKLEFVVDTSQQGDRNDVHDIPQWVAHWDDNYSGFITEKLRRSGIYPMAEQREPHN